MAATPACMKFPESTIFKFQMLFSKAHRPSIPIIEKIKGFILIVPFGTAGDIIVEDFIGSALAPLGAGIKISFNLIAAPHIGPQGEQHNTQNLITVFSPPLFEIVLFAGLFVHGLNNFVVHFFILLFFLCAFIIAYSVGLVKYFF
jgi:hypothetical protein